MSAAKEDFAPAQTALPEPRIELHEASEFIWLEADLLDSQSYPEWLALWTPTGHYVIPIERDGDDYAAHLNIIYDDRAMREARVQRLMSGLSMSASPSARTARTVSRFRKLEEANGTTVIRCAQHLVEYKYDRTRILAADVTYHLVRTRGADARIAMERKIVRLVNSDDALFGIGYLL